MTDEQQPTQPWISVELGGAVLHVPMKEGQVFTLPLTTEGMYALIGQAAEYVGTLKNPDVQKTLGVKAVGFLIDWFAGRK